MKTHLFAMAGAASLLTTLLPYLPDAIKLAGVVTTTIATIVHLQARKRAKAASKPRAARRKVVAQTTP